MSSGAPMPRGTTSGDRQSRFSSHPQVDRANRAKTSKRIKPHTRQRTTCRCNLKSTASSRTTLFQLSLHWRTFAELAISVQPFALTWSPFRLRFQPVDPGKDTTRSLPDRSICGRRNRGDCRLLAPPEIQAKSGGRACLTTPTPYRSETRLVVSSGELVNRDTQCG